MGSSANQLWSQSHLSAGDLKAIEAEEAKMQNEEMKSSAENAMKEIGMYQDIYEQIRTSHNIPIDWDEEDYEKNKERNRKKVKIRKIGDQRLSRWI